MIIFLDVDGVLVNAQSLRKASGMHSEADPKCIAVLNRIIEQTEASLVVSSCWRIGRTLIWLRELLNRWGVKGKVIGKTPDLGFTVTRGVEISTWIEEYEKSRDVGSMVILDDDADMDRLSKFLVHTDFEAGLTEADGDKAIAILKGANHNGDDKRRSAAVV